MLLWSYQFPGFSLTEGQVDLTKSQYANDYPDAYRKLYGFLRPNTLVWCKATNDGRSDWLREGRQEWQLNVPNSEFLKVVDCMVWNGILGNESAKAPKALDDNLRTEAFEQFPTDIPQRDRYYDNKIYAMLHPAGDPWNSLFISDPNDPKADILLKHPIDPSWVRRVAGRPYSEYLARSSQTGG